MTFVDFLPLRILYPSLFFCSFFQITLSPTYGNLKWITSSWVRSIDNDAILNPIPPTTADWQVKFERILQKETRRILVLMVLCSPCSGQSDWFKFDRHSYLWNNGSVTNSIADNQNIGVETMSAGAPSNQPKASSLPLFNRVSDRVSFQVFQRAYV